MHGAGFKDHFSGVADAYAVARPVYPDALYDALAQHVPHNAQVWEPGCGSGQATRGLVARFAKVHATDPSATQLAAHWAVNGGADAARVGSSGEAVYAACKAGLVGLSKTLARELATKNVSVNVVCPGPTDTALLKSVADTSSNPEKLLEAFKNAVPMRRLGQPEDYPGIIALLASDDANFITGQVISVSGGLTMAG